MTEVGTQAHGEALGSPREPATLIGERPRSWWTGKPPEPGLCPGVGDDGILRSLEAPNLTTLTRQGLLDYWDNAWTLTEVLFSALQGSAAFHEPPPHRLRHPLIFYYCHPAVLYVNTLGRVGLGQPIDPYFERRFALGVDEMPWDELSQGAAAWPSVEAVTIYRARVYRWLRRLIEEHAQLDQPWAADSPGARGEAEGRLDVRWAVLLGIEHERIHLETSSVLIRELPLRWLKRPAMWPEAHPRTPSSSCLPREGVDYPEDALLAVGEGEVCIGKARHEPAYGWDNEYGSRRMSVPAFRAGRSLVSNGQFLRFVASGGYRERRHWSSEGWQWRERNRVERPAFWIERGSRGDQAPGLRLCFEVVPMQWSWPALVTFHEARAYAAWLSERQGVPYRLLTEAEHHRLRGPPDPTGGEANALLRWGSEGPVRGGSLAASGAYDVFGNAWQWCEDHFAALPGFSPDPLYEDFSTPCFDGMHNLILGGSFASTGSLTSPWARFHFRRHFMQHAGFRLVQPRDVRVNPYESEPALNQYLLLHYGTREQTSPIQSLPDGVLEFPSRCARLLTRACLEYGMFAAAAVGGPLDLVPRRALDLGCSVGGASFELAREFPDVLGVDLSARFIAAAEALQVQGELGYSQKEEGEIQTARSARVDPTLCRDRVRFRVADACALPGDLGTFDAILLANVLCRLARPRACLAALADLLRAGGLLLITSPYSWLREYTPRAEWLGGRSGEHGSRDGLRALLSPDFELLRESDEPLLLCEHARKFEYVIAHATLWRRRG